MLLAVLGLGAAAVMQAPELWNVLPPSLAPAAQAMLANALGAAAAPRLLTPGELEAAAAAAKGPVVLFGVDELQLEALARRQLLAVLPAATWLPAALPPRARARDGCFALLLQSPITLAYDPRAVAPADVPRTWVELATSPLAQDQLALCGPEVDPTPWLGWMSLRLAQGGSEADGYALWTAFDARALYHDSYAAAEQALTSGAARFCVLPRALATRARQLQGQAPLAVRDPDDGQPTQWLGVALLAGAAGDDAVAMLRRLLQPALRQQLARDLGMAPVPVAEAEAAAAPRTEADAPVQQWLQHFQQRLRGQGRTLENLDGWLDFGFALLFCGFLLLVWHRMRRSEADARES